MKILITGANGFVGKHLVLALKKVHEILEFDVDKSLEDLEKYTQECNFVFHLAGVNRPLTEEEFQTGNVGLTSDLIKLLEKNSNFCPIVISSSTQAALDNPYGKSKKAAEDVAFEYSKRNNARVCVYRLPNIFGKWCKPNYNSAVATFCHNIANGLDIKINDPNVDMTLVYIDDVVEEFLLALDGKEHKRETFCEVPVVHKVKLGKIAELLYEFKKSNGTLNIPNVGDAFEKVLYSTYLTYLPDFSYGLKMNVDNRGSFTEIIRTPDRGQFSVNVTKPGITKGNHWHHTKCEKFLIVAGKAVVRFRKVNEKEIVEYPVNGDEMRVVDIPPGYTHNFTNIGTSDLITFIWANEAFNPEKPDTFFEEV